MNWEKIFSNDKTNRGLISKIYKQLIQFSIKNLIKKWAEDLNRQLFEEDIQIAGRHMKRYSTSLIIREMQMKPTMRYHLILIRMAIIKKSTNNKGWKGCWKKKGTYINFFLSTVSRPTDVCDMKGFEETLHDFLYGEKSDIKIRMKKRQKILGYRHKKKKKQKTNFLIKSTHRSDSLETVFSHYGHSVSSKNKKYRILLSLFFLPRLHACLLAHFSHVQLSVTSWTAARQAPLSRGILQACHALLQGIFLTQGSNPGLLCFLHWQVDSTAESPGEALVKVS